MTTKFPSNLQKVLDSAILHLWDKRLPNPDLTLLHEWLETDGWDLVVAGLNSSCTGLCEISESLNDESLIEYFDLEKENITNMDRLLYARGHIESLLSASMDSFHSIPVEMKEMPPAELCFTMYFHGQGGATFYGIEVAHGIPPIQ